MTLRAPFPWFGGKSRVAHLVWARFGDVPNYVSPFLGTAAVEMLRPHTPRFETLSDADGFLANFWRAVVADPAGVSRAASRPMLEADLEPLHRTLIDARPGLERKLRRSLSYYDAGIAGLWAWGVCSTIGEALQRSRPLRPSARDRFSGFRGHPSPARSLAALKRRFRNSVVLCGDWTRAVTPIRLASLEIVTGVFLDPPYGEAEHSVAYAHPAAGVADAVRDWALLNGDHPKLRIALCGYDSEHSTLGARGWTAVPWKAKGGFGNQAAARGRLNAARETIWFSPHCLRPAASLDLFDTLEVAHG